MRNKILTDIEQVVLARNGDCFRLALYPTIPCDKPTVRFGPTREEMIEYSRVTLTLPEVERVIGLAWLAPWQGLMALGAITSGNFSVQ